MDDRATLSDMADAEISALLAEGITPTPAEIVEVNALAWSVETPEVRRLLSRGRPVMVGGSWLWPLTMLAVDWLDRNGYRTDTVTPAIGYAMAFGRDESAMMTHGRDAEKAVEAWYKRLSCTPDEFVEAIKQIDRDESRIALPADPDGKSMSIGDFSAFLAAVVGGDPDFWERRCSVAYCLSVLSMYALHNHADRRPCKSDPKLQAMRALGICTERIRESRKAKESAA